MSIDASQLDPKRWKALAIIATAQLMMVLDSSIVNIALPKASLDLGIQPTSQQWVVTAYSLAFGSLLLLGGRVSDYLGRKRIFQIGLLGFAVSSAIGGLATTGSMLFASRGLQGAFAAFMAPAGLSIISTTFTEGHERAKAFGVYGAISGGGAAIGLIAGGILTEFANWRWCLLVNVPIAIFTWVGGRKVIKESVAKDGSSYDLPGAILVTIGLGALVYGFTLAELHSWSATSTIVSIALGTILLCTFIGYERRAKEPLLPLRIVTNRNRGGSFLASFLVGTGMMAMFLFLTLYFQDVLGYSPLKSGFSFLPFSLMVITMATVSSKLLPKVGPRPLMVSGLFSASIGLYLLSNIEVHSSYFTHVLPSCFLVAGGMGLSFVAFSSTALFGVDHHDAGVASATLNAAQQVGGALGLSLLYTLAHTASVNYVGNLAAHLPKPPTAGTLPTAIKNQAEVHGFQVGFLGGSIGLFLAMIVAATFITKDAGKVGAPEELVAAGF